MHCLRVWCALEIHCTLAWDCGMASSRPAHPCKTGCDGIDVGLDDGIAVGLDVGLDENERRHTRAEPALTTTWGGRRRIVKAREGLA